MIDLILEEEDLNVDVFIDEGLSPLQYALNAASSEGKAKQYAAEAKQSAELSLTYSNQAGKSAFNAKQYAEESIAARDAAYIARDNTQEIERNVQAMADGVETTVSNFDAHVEEVYTNFDAHVDDTYTDFNNYYEEKKETLKGFSPLVNITEGTNQHTVDITDEQGTKSFVVKDGVDYVLTEEDKEEIAEMAKPKIIWIEANEEEIFVDGEKAHWGDIVDWMENEKADLRLSYKGAPLLLKEYINETYH